MPGTLLRMPRFFQPSVPGGCNANWRAREAPNRRPQDQEPRGLIFRSLLQGQDSPVFQAFIGIFGLLFAACLAGTFSQPPCTITQELHNGHDREMALREDNRRQPNGMLYPQVASAALAHPVSREWRGYRQRSMG